MRAPIPRVYLGTMTFGWAGQTSSAVDQAAANNMVHLFVDYNDINSMLVTPRHYIDTARIYAGGKTEPMVGAAIAATRELGPMKGKFLIGTKAHPSMEGGLSPEGMRAQLRASLEALQVDSVSEYYLHQPDTNHSLLDSLKCVHEMVKEGLVKSLGMSNYHAWEMERAFELCDEHGLTRPTVYQGLYNPLNRLVEKELLPLLKKNNCSFIAYNPLAAGLLTGKHKSKGEVPEGRFKDNPNYLPRFYTEKNFEALANIENAMKFEEGNSMIQLTYRWLLRHSALGLNDGILIGASSLEQLFENLSACAGASIEGPIFPNAVKYIDDAWIITEEVAFPYWRSYSADMPDRENLDQGASYSAAKKT